MTRGRKKDLTIPTTRALAQQRDYRARRAQYVSDLEDRCRRAEAENAQLRIDLAASRAAQAASPQIFSNPQTTQASSELIHNLSLASASLARFQQLAFPESYPFNSTSGSSPSSSSQHMLYHADNLPNLLRPASFPSPAPSLPYTFSPTHSGPPSHHPPRRKRLYREDSPGSAPSPSRNSPQSGGNSRSPSPESECCLGMMDCHGLVEPDNGRSNDPGDCSSHIRGA